ncbi:MAG: hypothetical protein MNPFHGCM_01834 [Gemmatimonadaceae bacterium]|nr:hypothetical protein [Gemmatimonadaceae bacterium]
MIGGRWPIASCVAVVMACSREPAPSVRLPEPLPPTPVTLLAGDSLYVMHCQSCHGRHALGTDLGPPLVHSVYAPRHHADAAFVLAVRNGVRAHHWTFGDMQPVPLVTSAQVESLTAYVRWLQMQAGIH